MSPLKKVSLMKNWLHEPQKSTINEDVTICKLLQLVNPATSAVGERSFLTARNITKLNNMERFSNLTVLNSHKERTDKLCLAINLENEFAGLNDNQKRNFGAFNF